MTDITGRRFGRLVAVTFVGVINNEYIWACNCDCGNVKNIIRRNLITGNTNSCGCLSLENKTTHGLRKHPLYTVWDGIKCRCNNPKSDEYHNYGAKGIKMCDQWLNDFKSFYDWALANGWKKGLEIEKDKIPSRLGIPALLYSPEFCSILTKRENNRIKKSIKLSPEIAASIRASDKSHRQLANDYSVAKGVIQKIKENKMWF